MWRSVISGPRPSVFSDFSNFDDISHVGYQTKALDARNHKNAFIRHLGSPNDHTISSSVTSSDILTLTVIRLRHYRRSRTIYTSNRLAHILAKVVFPYTRILVVAHLFVGQLRSFISIRDSGAGLRVDECGRVLLEPPSSHTALGFPSNL